MVSCHLQRQVLPFADPQISKTLEAHASLLTALDFTEPYGTLVTASKDETQPCVWDLLSGDLIARLRGHTGTIRCLQVDNQLCLSGSEDGTVRMWDLKNLMEEDDALSDLVEEDEDESNARNGTMHKDNACIRVLLGHTKAVTALYFEDDCLARRSLCVLLPII
jgi:division protein 1